MDLADIWSPKEFQFVQEKLAEALGGHCATVIGLARRANVRNFPILRILLANWIMTPPNLIVHDHVQKERGRRLRS